MRESFDGCLGSPWNSGSDLRSMTALPAPAVGDEAAAYAITTVRADGIATSEIEVVVRRGPIVQFYDAQQYPGLSSPDQFDGIVRTGDDKVAAALTGTSAPMNTTTSTARTPAPTGIKPTCDEVQAAIAQMSPSDVAILNPWQILFFSRLPGSADGWRILTQPTATNATPASYYDWTPSGGLTAPVVISDADEKAALMDASVMLITMRCATPIVPPTP